MRLAGVHILILAAIALVLFGGRGKVSDLMGDFGKGINSFKKGSTEKDDPKVINADTRKRTRPRSDPRLSIHSAIRFVARLFGPVLFPDRAGAS